MSTKQDGTGLRSRIQSAVEISKELAVEVVDEVLWNPYASRDIVEESPSDPSGKGAQEQHTHMVMGTLDLSAMDSYVLWVWALCWVSVQLGSFALTGDSFFGVLSGGVVQSLHLATGYRMTWHMLTGSLLWFLGFVQISGTSLRNGKLAWVHRWSGRLCLIVWFGIVGPTAFYLSLFVGTGKINAQFTMAAFAVTGMDTSVLASYYMWRALVVAFRQKRGRTSLGLHGRAMRLGMMFTMLILFQRPVQFMMICCRYIVLTVLSLLPASWTLPQSLIFLKSWLDLAADYNSILSFSTVVGRWP